MPHETHVLSQTQPVQEPLKSLVVPAITHHTATVIFVHGLGDTGDGWRPVADMFREDPALGHVKWLLPHSPILPLTANMGIDTPSWHDVYSFGFDTTEDENGMLLSRQMLDQLITAEINTGIDPSRIIIGGFSQGAAMALLTGLTAQQKLAGVVSLSGWLPLRDKFKTMAPPHAASIPVFWGHGTVDPLVLHQFGRESVEFLVAEIGLRRCAPPEHIGLSFNSYDGVGHTTCPQELDDLRAWITALVPNKG